jgi:hypothetical protein
MCSKLVRKIQTSEIEHGTGKFRVKICAESTFSSNSTNRNQFVPQNP